MDIKYTEAQAIALNSLAEAAKMVRLQGKHAVVSAENILFQLENNYQPSQTFGKNKLAEAVAGYNAVSAVAGAVCGSLTNAELEESFALANREVPNSLGGRHQFRAGE